MPPSGRIVTISGMDTHRYVAGHGILASAKAALEALTRYLAVELGPRGITVNAVNPGYVETDSVAMYLADEAGRKAFFEEIEGATPLRARPAGGGGGAGRVPLLRRRRLDAGAGPLPGRRHLPPRTRPQRALVAADGALAPVTSLRPPARRG